MTTYDRSHRTLVEALQTHAVERGDGLSLTYLKDGEDVVASWTFSELDRRARRVAAALQAIGAEGDRALLLFPPGLDFVAAFYGCLYARRVAVPVSTPHASRLGQSLPRLQAIARSATPRVLLTTAGVAATGEALRGSAQDLASMRVVSVDALPERESQWRDPGVTPETVAFLQYTSGSTAAPRGVVVTHGNLIANLRAIRAAFRTSPETPLVTWLPVYHDMGLIGCILHPITTGFPAYVMSPAAFLQKPVRWLAAISRFRAYISGGPNFAYDYCVRRIRPEQRDGLDLSSWTVAFNGAEPVRAGTLVDFAEVFAPHGLAAGSLSPCYGLAESTLFVTGRVPGEAVPVEALDTAALATGRAVVDANGRALVGCGRARDDTRIAVVDPERLTPCPDGDVGEVWVAGPSVAQGYWQLADDTHRTFRASIAGSGDGPYLRTGDLGFLRAGELFITGRSKDLIIVDGRNHYPQDIELTVERSHPLFRPGSLAAFSVDVASAERLIVVAEADRARGPDGEDAASSVLRAARRAVAAEHELELHDLFLVKAGTIPKTTSGKIRRRSCRDGFLAGTLEAWTPRD